MAMPVDEERWRSVHSTSGNALEVGADTGYERSLHCSVPLLSCSIQTPDFE
jgi:hypothetical protein